MYITIFPNFSEEEYKMCVKCAPYFPTRSFCWRKKSGAFKFDTTSRLNNINAEVNGNTLVIKNKTGFDEIAKFLNIIIQENCPAI